jgi:hypothetical protein
LRTYWIAPLLLLAITAVEAEKKSKSSKLVVNVASVHANLAEIDKLDSYAHRMVSEHDSLSQAFEGYYMNFISEFLRKLQRSEVAGFFILLRKHIAIWFLSWKVIPRG